MGNQLKNNNIQNENKTLTWKSLDLETKIAIPIILLIILGIFIYNFASGVTKK